MKTDARAKELAIADNRTSELDLDWDVLDPAYFPAVSRPVPFGLSPAVLLRLIEAVWTIYQTNSAGDVMKLALPSA